MYKTRNRILILGIAAILIAASLTFNVKQLFELKYYQSLVSNHQAKEKAALIENKSLNENKPIDTTIAIKSVPVNKAELQCLAESIYFESGSQSLVGKYAVGHVVLNRVAKPNYPKTVCGVINHRIGNTCMFSWKCSEPKTIPTSSHAWKQSHQVAYKLLSYKRKDLVDITDGATHFHAAGIDPKWKLKKITKIDDHLFYK